MKPTIRVETLGCRLNLFESDGITGQFLASERYAPAAENDNPDIIIVNTCTVTDQADNKNRQLIARAVKKHPGSRVIVTGCYAQTDPEDCAMPGVFLVVGNNQKSKILSLYEEALALQAKQTGVSEGVSEKRAGIDPMDVFAYGNVLPVGHTRAYLKIQDGCDRKCTYCKIPRARGRGISRPLEDILDHARELDEKGVPEIVLTGVNLGWYREGGVRFNQLVERILNVLRSSRLRLSSIEPCDVDQGLAELSLHPRFCNFLHVPLQSGSREILKRMRRTYNPVSFRQRVEAFVRVNPDVFLGTDVITGFPGEGEAEFEETYSLCRDLGFANIHAFPFSPRKDTAAAEMEGRAPVSVVQKRMNRLRDLKAAGLAAYQKRFIGRVQTGIVEKSSDSGGEALSDNFLRLRFSGSLPRGSVHDFRITSSEENFCYSIPL